MPDQGSFVTGKVSWTSYHVVIIISGRDNEIHPRPHSCRGNSAVSRSACSMEVLVSRWHIFSCGSMYSAWQCFHSGGGGGGRSILHCRALQHWHTIIFSCRRAVHDNASIVVVTVVVWWWWSRWWSWWWWWWWSWWWWWWWRRRRWWWWWSWWWWWWWWWLWCCWWWLWCCWWWLRWWEHSALQGIKASSIVHAWWRWERGAKESVYIFLLKAREFKESWLLPLFPWSASACSTNSTLYYMYVHRETNKH